VYKVRHRVWSCHSDDITAPHPAATLTDIRAGQSTDEDKELQEEREEDEDDKKKDQREHWNDGLFDG